MICEAFRDASVSDDPREQERFRLHAAACSACAAALESDRELLQAAAEWRRSAPAPAPTLEARITAAMAAAQNGHSVQGKRMVFPWWGLRVLILVSLTATPRACATPLGVGFVWHTG